MLVPARRVLARCDLLAWRAWMRSSTVPEQMSLDEDGVLLADAVGAVGGLGFGDRVPPRVVMDDGVGGGEIEPGAAGLE